MKAPTANTVELFKFTYCYVSVGLFQFYSVFTQLVYTVSLYLTLFPE